jgi:adenosylcobinamide-GDP ribazoletransferase
MTWQMARYPLARREGLSVFFGQGLGRAQLLLAGLVAAATAWLALGWLVGSVLLLLTWLGATLLARFALARLGGLTGDIYGATCEVIEVVLLMALLVI